MGNILMTGSTGFLGKHILNKNRNEVTTLGRKNCDILSDFVNDPYLTIKDSYETIIHAAGKAHSIPVTDEQKKEFYDINVQGTKNLLNGIERAPSLPKAFVFISSVAVYGKETGHLINEDTPLLAADPYGDSKVEAEKLILNWCTKNNITCTILRLPLLAGPNPPGNLESIIKGIKAGYYFNIDGGKAKKSIVLATDVASIITVVSKIGGIYNLTDRYHPDFSELSQSIAKQMGKSKPLNIPGWFAKILARSGDLIGSKFPIDSKRLQKITSDLTFDDSRAVSKFNWNPERVLDGFKII
ncbi:NAD(P)-dependent oxidoreductase [Mucilaginibacter sp.]|uniref:NAD-dependent epimerase/dehydratase family protein n=1 Tax=Mucilaginibacter sp. TaxID=1882438 RepID=UPI002622CEF8|nr:NAD-dependent epimerase/dehydratase family protein [Mucilaginibacter sp.]MDB4921102.1 UDP-galactose-4-epimerase [Mucilaginibacter sp.]